MRVYMHEYIYRNFRLCCTLKQPGLIMKILRHFCVNFKVSFWKKNQIVLKIGKIKTSLQSLISRYCKEVAGDNEGLLKEVDQNYWETHFKVS